MQSRLRHFNLWFPIITTIIRIYKTDFRSNILPMTTYWNIGDTFVAETVQRTEHIAEDQEIF